MPVRYSRVLADIPTWVEDRVRAFAVIHHRIPRDRECKLLRLVGRGRYFRQTDDTPGVVLCSGADTADVLLAHDGGVEAAVLPRDLVVRA